jgi:hypothetical protein
MKGLIAIFATAFLIGCASTNAAYKGTTGVVTGIKDDIVGVTAGAFEITAGVIRDVDNRIDPKSE